MKDTHGGNVWDAAETTKRGISGIIDFSASINPLGISPRAVREIKSSIKLLPHYPDPDSRGLKQAIASFYGVDPEHIIPANGSTELIYLIPSVLRPKTALIIEPAFSEYRRALELNGLKPDSFMLREARGFSINLSELSRALKKNYGIVCIANPANPTGAAIEKESMMEISSLCKKHNTRLLVDEAFVDFNEGISIRQEAVFKRHIIVLRSLTKFFGIAGLRLGFSISHPSTAREIKEKLPPWTVNTVASKAAVASLNDRVFHKNTLRLIQSERRFLYDALSSVKGLKPYASAANFLMVRVSSKRPDAPELKAMLLKRGILIRELSAWPGLGKKFFRIAVRKRGENALLIKALKEILG
ncbi:MAG: threonine-phosphate decarboxylase CobD [Deltaproteobacteria bacterium]